MSQRDPDLHTIPPNPTESERKEAEQKRLDCLVMAQDHHRAGHGTKAPSAATVLDTAQIFYNFVKGTTNGQ